MTTSSRPSGWRVMASDDAGWHGIESVRMFLDIEVPPFARVRHAMRQLSAETGIVCWYDRSRPLVKDVQPEDVEGWLDRVLVETSQPVQDVELAVAMQAAPLDDLPIRIMVGPTWVTIRQSHAVGDGWSSINLIAQVLRQASSDRPLDLPWTSLRPGRRALVAARVLSRHPGTVLRAVARRKQLRGGHYELASQETAGLHPTVLYRRSPRGFSDALRTLRDEHFAGSSVAAMTLVGLRTALATELPAPRPGVECVFDNRREARASRNAFGNWSAGVYLTSSDDTSPVAVSQSMATARRTALPVVSSAAARARAMRGISAARTVAVSVGAPRLTLSFTQGHGPLGSFPGIDDLTSTVALATTPNGPESITLTAADLRGTLHLSVSYYPQVWDRGSVGRAVDRFFGDPGPLFRMDEMIVEETR